MQPTRRQVLLGGVALTSACVTGCTTKKPPAPPAPTTDDRLRAEAVAREQELVTAYLAAMSERPELTQVLSPLLGDHAAHLAALGGAAAAATPSSLTRRPRAAVVRDLLARERSAAAAHAAAAERAESAPVCERTLAPLLASLAASEASHLVVL